MWVVRARLPVRCALSLVSLVFGEVFFFAGSAVVCTLESAFSVTLRLNFDHNSLVPRSIPLNLAI